MPILSILRGHVGNRLAKYILYKIKFVSIFFFFQLIHSLCLNANIFTEMNEIFSITYLLVKDRRNKFCLALLKYGWEIISQCQLCTHNTSMQVYVKYFQSTLYSTESNKIDDRIKVYIKISNAYFFKIQFEIAYFKIFLVFLAYDFQGQY